jgi:xanthine dehydrogenase YagS FAD-binding subunit
MQPFEYARPTSKEDVVKLLSAGWGESEVLAGGTDLLDRTKDFLSTPKRLVSLQSVKELRGIRSSASGLSIGATATLTELAESQQVRRDYPGLAEAAEEIGGPQLRNVGTVGGELCQRPRCWYYRAGYGLLAQDNGKPLVPEGDNRYHAIFGNSGPAYFVSPSMLAPILIALGAKVRLFGLEGWHDLPLDRFFVTPKNDQEREHALKPNELVAEIIVPPARGAKSAVYTVSQRETLDWPLVQAAVVLSMDGKTVKSASVVLGHVAPVPWRSPEAEQALAGKTISATVADEAGKAAVSKATPLSKNRYKVQLARVAVKRAILRAAHGEA